MEDLFYRGRCVYRTVVLLSIDSRCKRVKVELVNVDLAKRKRDSHIVAGFIIHSQELVFVTCVKAINKKQHFFTKALLVYSEYIIVPLVGTDSPSTR